MMIKLLSWLGLRSSSIPTTTKNSQLVNLPFNDGNPPNFLFVGNSYTAQNSLKDMFDNVLKDGIPEWNETAKVHSINPPGRSLGAHVEEMEIGNTGAGRQLADWLRDEPSAWKWVTLQDQSQVPGFFIWDWEGTEYYRSKQAAIQLNEYIEAAGGQTMFYMTWGRRNGDNRNPDLYPDFLTMQDLLVEGYFGYVEATSTANRPTYVAPVGLSFRTIHNDLVAQNITPQETGTLFHSLYTNDGSHPTPLGTYVAALTIFSSMFGLDPNTINWFPSQIDEADATAVRDAVARTILDTFETGFIQYPWTQAWTSTTGSSGGTLPTDVPSPLPTSSPTSVPSTLPTPPPTDDPTPSPTDDPTPSPTDDPTGSPSAIPTFNPIPITVQPTAGAIPQTTAPSSGGGTTNTPWSTAADQTSSPTLPITVDTKGSITIEIQYDDYPKDIAWTFLRQGAASGVDPLPLYFQPYNYFNETESGGGGIKQTETFTGLNQSETYLFKISDAQGDGLCCGHGNGYVKIVDNNNFGRSTILYDLAVTLGYYYEIDIEIGSFGQASVTHKSQRYVPSTWPDLENQLWAPANLTATSPAWPGEFTNSTYSVVVNMDLLSVSDNPQPQNVSWVLYRQTLNQTLQADEDPTNDWIRIYSWNGTTSIGGGLNSSELSSIHRGWYRFVVTRNDGNCCGNTTNTTTTSNHGGYVTLTGPISATQGPGLIWGHNGDFGRETTMIIRFRMDKTGHVSRVQWEANDDARSQAPSSAPSISLSPTFTPVPTTYLITQIDRLKAGIPTLKPVPTQSPALSQPSRISDGLPPELSSPSSSSTTRRMSRVVVWLPLLASSLFSYLGKMWW